MTVLVIDPSSTFLAFDEFDSTKNQYTLPAAKQQSQYGCGEHTQDVIWIFALTYKARKPRFMIFRGRTLGNDAVGHEYKHQASSTFPVDVNDAQMSLVQVA